MERAPIQCPGKHISKKRCLYQAGRGSPTARAAMASPTRRPKLSDHKDKTAGCHNYTHAPLDFGGATCQACWPHTACFHPNLGPCWTSKINRRGSGQMALTSQWRPPSEKARAFESVRSFTKRKPQCDPRACSKQHMAHSPHPK